ncbi:DNA-processing protein DprA [Candidatus Magnetominusculus xianensis]|uniref:DNA processing protein DprA n=1 Tax=Candidatus Magnetominusculus xianensis TaxID=1748249 RepID=A0ABR5SL92_9BACT|nr:DNA-processing protein DprA [Candidatus Magnetominusculus xianensis]KWT94359.1 DNA processing protein DprA [Candidatus Magnetominusculus xianensis]MBF0403991.1 DNA-protecting protein DprA [Nitrospirota bacterium]
MQEELRYLLALSSIPVIGPGTTRKLLKAFGEPKNIFRASLKALLQVEGVGKGRAQGIVNFTAWDETDKVIEKCEKTGIKILHYEDAGFPSLLKEVPDHPLILFVKGQIRQEDRYAIAIVGTRKASHYGISVAERFTDELTAMGFTIVSGMARGIDSVAHKKAIQNNASTIAVLGSGVDVVYPPESAWLYKRIAEEGAVVSEFLPGTKPLRENFPVRNRLISGLSLGVLVVEASQRSGALITAEFALEQGREVFAVPGNIMSSSFVGTHSLIQKGAKLVQSASDIVEELRHILKGFVKSKAGIEKGIALDAEEKRLYEFISHEPIHIDEIIRKSGVASNEALTLLLGLEIKGVVRQIDGKKFQLA